ncbi:hAT-like transposase, RNase-H fold [Dillenia turbinata]|uniref:HAT-like transposase, RNase-H fold n=1 Tax=Dillenia turbinata TaxID=194707 RepID=A0AAN8UMM9_9MAGN
MFMSPSRAESTVKFQKAIDLLEVVDSKYINEMTPPIRVAKDWELEDNKIKLDNTHRSFRVRGLLTDVDMEYVINLLPFFKRFYDIAIKLSSSYYVTGNEYMKEIYGIDMILDKMHESKDSGTTFMVSKMKRKYDKYSSNIDKINIFLLNAIAFALDLRFKLNYVIWFYVGLTMVRSLQSMKKEEWNTLVSRMLAQLGGLVELSPPFVDMQRRVEHSYEIKVYKKTYGMFGYSSIVYKLEGKRKL